MNRLEKFSDELPKIEWIKNDPQKHKFFEEGSVFLVALQVKNSKTKKVRWEFDVVETDCDGYRMTLYYRGKSEIYDSWNFEDFEYFYLLEGKMPMSKDQYEQT